MKNHPSYESAGVVGRGRFATVYRARDVALKREVAIKELHEEVRRDETFLSHFWDEARFLANVEHDNVVQIYGLDRERGWVIMELAAGGLDSTASRGPLAPDVVRGVLRQVLDGLECLHLLGRVHGAVKPSNVLVTYHGHVKLSDSTGLNPAPGAAKHLAPEQIDPSFGPVGPGADLYCLGFTALELLAGPGFAAHFTLVDASRPEQGWRRVHGSRDLELPTAASVAPGVPGDVARVIDRLLQKDVAARYASAAEALKDLADDAAPPVPADPAPPTLPPTAAAPPPPARPATRIAPAALPTGGPAGYGRDTLLPTMFPVLQQPGEPGSRPAVSPQPAAKPRPSAPAQPALETVSDQPLFPRWSRGWVNQKLENPWVLYPVCGTIAFVTVLLLADLLLGRRQRVQPTQPPPAGQPVVRVTSTPPGADVFIDDVPQQEKTDATFTVSPGRHRFRVERVGFLVEDEEREVNVSAEGKEATEVRFAMKETPEPVAAPRPAPPAKTPSGRLAVRSTPEKAAIFVDGKERGTTPAELELPPGKHSLRLVLAGYDEGLGEVDVKAGSEPTKYDALLKRQREPGRFALLVGVRSAGAGLPVFQHAPGDMVELGRLLTAAGYARGSVTVLRQTPGASPETTPGAEQVRRAAEALVKDRVPGDVLLLALAGPAVAPAGGPGYFCPASSELGNPATLVSLDWLFRLLASCPAKTKVVLLDGNRAGPASGDRPPPAWPEDFVPAGVTLLVSTTGGAPGYVHSEDRHGAFWAFVLRGLRGEANTDRDAKVSPDELARFVIAQTDRHVRDELKARQVPKLVDHASGSAAVPLAVPNESLKRLAEGDSLLGSKQYSAAEERFSRAIELQPGLLEARLRRAVSRYYLAKYAEMIDDCDQVLRADADCAAAFDYRGDAHQESAGPVENMNKSRLRQALDDYTAAIRIDPDYGPVYKSRATTYGLLKDNESAVRDFTKAIELAPVPSGRLFELRARALRRLKRLPEAADDFTESIRLKPADESLYRQRAGVYDELGEKDRAAADRAKAAELRKSSPKPATPASTG